METAGDLYSRVGKSRAQKAKRGGHQKKRVLSQQTGKFRVTRENVNKLLEELTSNQDRSQKSQTLSPSSFFLRQSREDYYHIIVNQIQSPKDKVPPCGYYNLKYQGVDKNNKVPQFEKFTPRKFKVVKNSELMDTPEIKQRVPNTLHFAYQIKRKADAQQTVHENRFQSYNSSPNIYTKVRKIQTPNISSATKRQELFKTPETSPQYTPIYSQVHKRSNIALNFAKLSGRSSGVSSSQEITLKRVTYNQIDKKVPGVNIGKMSSRPSSKELPTYMVRTASRNGLQTVSDKTLQMNNYSRSNYMSLGDTYSRQSFHSNVKNDSMMILRNIVLANNV